MLVRCWIFTIALGLLTLSGQAQEQAGGTGREAERNEQPTQTLPIPIPIEIVEDEAAAEARKNSEEETSQREIDYLVIQKEMNATTQSIDAATRDMRDYALYSTVLVAIGTFMLAVTLSLTRQANKAAMRMVETQRAWMCFDNYDAHPMGSGKHATRGEYKAGYSFTPIWKNTGKYPAKILTVYTT